LNLFFLEDDAKYRINKFIIIILIELVKLYDSGAESELELIHKICKHTDLDRGRLLFNYCIEVAKENKKDSLIPIFVEYIEMADSDDSEEYNEDSEEDKSEEDESEDDNESKDDSEELDDEELDDEESEELDDEDVSEELDEDKEKSKTEKKK